MGQKMTARKVHYMMYNSVADENSKNKKSPNTQFIEIIGRHLDNVDNAITREVK